MKCTFGTTQTLSTSIFAAPLAFNRTALGKLHSSTDETRGGAKTKQPGERIPKSDPVTVNAFVLYPHIGGGITAPIKAALKLFKKGGGKTDGA